MSESLINKALSKMKCGKAAGPSGIIFEMTKAAGEKGVYLTRQLAEAFSTGLRSQQTGRRVSSWTSIRAGTKPFTLTTHKLEKFAFIDLEKAFDHVTRKVAWWALRSLGVDEWAVRVIQGMYSNEVVCWPMGSTVKGLMCNRVMCNRALSLARCSSSWCWKHFHVSSTMVCCESVSVLMTSCSSQTLRRSVSPSPRRGRLAWKVKGSMSTWRRQHFRSAVLGITRNLLNTAIESATTVQDSRFKIVYCYTSVSRHIHTKHIVTSWKLFRSCNHSKKKHIMTSWHRNQCCKTHWANNTGQDRGQLIQFGHCPGQHCRPIRTTLILNTRKVSLDNLILSAFLKERDNMASFSNSDSCAPRLISLKTDCGILWVQGLVEAIESPWFLWRMFKKSNFALVAPDESRILMNYNFSLKEQTSVISLYYIQHPEGSATSKLINPWVTIYKW